MSSKSSLREPWTLRSKPRTMLSTPVLGASRARPLASAAPLSARGTLGICTVAPSMAVKRGGRACAISLLSLALFTACGPSSSPSLAASPRGESSRATSAPTPRLTGTQKSSGATSPAGAPATPLSPNTSKKAEPSISIHHGDHHTVLSRTELLSHPKVETVTIPDRAAYKKSLTFQAVPVVALFDGIDFKQGDTIEFDTLDGFSSSLDTRQLLNTDPAGSIAYLAVEEEGKPWPKLGAGKNSAGPLYLIWKNPELSNIGQEQWPYQLRSFTIKESIEKRFPAIQPSSAEPADSPVRLGYKAFVKNCFTCHTLNGEGNARLGPDLNIPHSPTEYMHEEYFRQLVRNPQNLRSWKGSRMSAFSPAALPDKDLDNIITYLKHKAEQRRQTHS